MMKFFGDRFKDDYKNYLIIITALLNLLLNAGILINLDTLNASIILRVLITINFLTVFIFSWIFTVMNMQKQQRQKEIHSGNDLYNTARNLSENLQYTLKSIEDMISGYHSLDKKDYDKGHFVLQLYRIRDSIRLTLTAAERETGKLDE